MNGNKPVKLWFTDFWRPSNPETIRRHLLYQLLSNHWNIVLTADNRITLYILVLATNTGHEDIDCPSVFISKRRFHKFRTQLIKLLKKVFAKNNTI